MRAIPEGDRWKVSAWISEFKPEVVRSTDIDEALGAAKPSLTHRADRMLRWLNGKFPPGKRFGGADLGEWNIRENSQLTAFHSSRGSLNSSPLTPIGWNQNVVEMEFMIDEVLCKEMGLLNRQDDKGDYVYKLSPKGLLYLEGRPNAQSTLAFCAMWFSDEVLPLWTLTIEPAIRLAGYQPLKIDIKPHNNKIDDEIVASIRAAKFVVADCTGNRGGVYYEAGFAHGLGLPVIFMCRDDEQLHFDVRQYNCIFWKPEGLSDATTRLKNRILATLGQGPLKVE